MRIGVDGSKIPHAAVNGPVGSLDFGHELGLSGLFYRTVLDMDPALDRGELRAIRERADEFGMYIESGLGKVNPYANPETPGLRAVGDGDILLGFRRMMEACAEIGCVELWSALASYKWTFRGKHAYDLTVAEYAAFIRLTNECQARIDAGEIPDRVTYLDEPFDFSAAVALVTGGAAHLRKVCDDLCLEVTP